MVAKVLKGRKIDPTVEFAVAPGSREVLNMLAANGALGDIISAGARILESGCGPCIGLGFSPADGVVSLRTFNRNFAGRSGTKDDKVFLVSPETAVASALTGKITDPREMKKLFGIKYPKIEQPAEFIINDNMIEAPLSEKEAAKAEVIRGTTIVVPEQPKQLPADLKAEVLIKCGDKITTDHIMPAGAFLKLRSNVPEYAKVVFHCFNEKGKPSFAERAMKVKDEGRGGIIVAGASYGQGSSREHAALCPMYLGVRAVVAKSIERIHKANLINFCVVPIELANQDDYEKISQGDNLRIDGLVDAIKGKDEVKIVEENGRYEIIGQVKPVGQGQGDSAFGRAAEIYARTSEQKSREGKTMRIARFILALTIAAGIWTSGAAAKTNGNGKTNGDKLLPDDYVFAGVDGKLVQTGVDKWAFEFESAANIGETEIKAGQKLEMLGSATLEKMAADAKERSDAMFRIWAKVTKFEGKNYLFAVYYLSLRKLDQPTREAVKNEPNKTGQASTGQAVNAPNDV